jgi:phospholipase C
MKIRVHGVALLGALVAACSPNDSGSTFVTCQKLAPTAAVVPAGWGGSVFTIVMENKSRHEIFGNRRAPFINKLANQFAVANGYHDAFVHPSEANYLWMAAGQNFGVLDDHDPEEHHLDSSSHIADQIEMAGLTWKTYQESMGEPCGLESHGRYAAKHDPFVFFSDINGWDGKTFQRSQRCIDHVVDYSEIDRDLARNTIANYVFITPNLDNDMHDGSISDGDAWLAREIPKIMSSNAYKNGGAIFLMWDEGGGYPVADDPPFIVISPNAKSGMRSQLEYDTSSYLKTVQAILGLSPLPCGADMGASTMDDLFTVPPKS